MSVPDHPRPVVGFGVRAPMMRIGMRFTGLGYYNARPAARGRYFCSGIARYSGSPRRPSAKTRAIANCCYPPDSSSRQIGVAEKIGRQIRDHLLAIMPGEGTHQDGLADGQIRDDLPAF